MVRQPFIVEEVIDMTGRAARQYSVHGFVKVIEMV